MSENQFLRRYNQIALAIFLTWALILLSVISFSWWTSTQELADDVHRAANKPSVSGEEFKTLQGTITAYKSEASDDPEAMRDVRYVAMATGKVTAISNDAKALVFGEKGVGELGRTALVKTGMRGNRPMFDLIFVSFPNLNRHVIAKSIDSLDTVQQLDDSKFSAIIWDDRDKARFVIVDAESGTIQATRNLDFSSSSRASGETSASIAGTEADDAAAEPAKAAPPKGFE